MLSKRVQEMAGKIGQFYLEKNKGDYAATAAEIERTKFKEIGVYGSNSEIVIIKTGRPGMFIGKRGENVLNLEKYLNVKIHIEEVEDELSVHLIPEDPRQYDDWIEDELHAMREADYAYMDEDYFYSTLNP